MRVCRARWARVGTRTHGVSSARQPTRMPPLVEELTTLTRCSPNPSWLRASSPAHEGGSGAPAVAAHALQHWSAVCAKTGYMDPRVRRVGQVRAVLPRDAGRVAPGLLTGAAAADARRSSFLAWRGVGLLRAARGPGTSPSSLRLILGAVVGGAGVLRGSRRRYEHPRQAHLGLRGGDRSLRNASTMTLAPARVQGHRRRARTAGRWGA